MENIETDFSLDSSSRDGSSRRMKRREKLVTVTGAKILLGHIACLATMTPQLPHLGDGIHSESEKRTFAVKLLLSKLSMLLSVKSWRWMVG